MNKYNIRNVKEDDFLTIAEIANYCPPMVIERNSIYHLFTKFFANTSFIVETADKNAIGFLLGFISQDNPQKGYIHLLCVIPQWRKKGLAQELLDQFLFKLKENGCQKVSLITSPKNKKAINFYQKMGFKIENYGKEIIINGVNTIKNYNGPGEHKLICTKLLE
ncbi:MAG TPA: GNAT family N-acetyltransferase [Methanobacterium sp.]|nr:GNAT family N-acetyltransferase [Methanobacterium sp.]